MLQSRGFLCKLTQSVIKIGKFFVEFENTNLLTAPKAPQCISMVMAMVMANKPNKAYFHITIIQHFLRKNSDLSVQVPHDPAPLLTAALPARNPRHHRSPRPRLRHGHPAVSSIMVTIPEFPSCSLFSNAPTCMPF